MTEPLDTVLRLMPSEYHTGGLHDDDPFVRLWAVGHAMGYLAGVLVAEPRAYSPQSLSDLYGALSALRSQAQKEADRAR